jgi:hypothetical protein
VVFFSKNKKHQNRKYLSCRFCNFIKYILLRAVPCSVLIAPFVCPQINKFAPTKQALPQNSKALLGFQVAKNRIKVVFLRKKGG